MQEELDLIAAQLPEGVRLDSGDDVLCGRGEWLFERDGGRRVLAQMRGDLILSPKAAQRWANLLEARTAWLGEHGIPYVFAVAPAKHVVLPDYLPAGVAVGPRRPIVQIVFWLEKNESPVAVVYPLEELQAETERDTFDAHHSCWNANGAFIGYERVLGALPAELPVRRLARDAVGSDWRPRGADLVSDNRVGGAGRMLVTQCEAAPPTTCLVFGDRSSYRMLPYLSESFGRLVFAHLHSFDHALVAAERPDLVIGLADETALIDLPADVEAPGAAELAAHKLADGAELMPELAPLWAG